MLEKPGGASRVGVHLPLDGQGRAETKQWLENWKRVGPLLEAIRVEELRKLTDEESARIARDLLWPMLMPGGSDDAEGIEPMKDALQRLARGA